MRTILCLLSLLPFLGACASTQVAKAPECKPPAPASEVRSDRPPKPNQERVDMTSLARVMQGLPASKCLATGVFSLSADHDSLTLEVRCGDEMAEILTHKEDRGFHIPFENAVITARTSDEAEPIVYLHLLQGDEHRMFKLESVKGDLTYSFADMVPETMVPIPL